MSHLAPAGTPIGLRDLLSLARATGHQQDAQRFAAWLARRLDAQQAWLLSSGRAALVTVLRVIREQTGDTHRNEVVLPAYTCYSVAAAVVRAGLRPRLCDLDPATLDYDPTALARLDTSATLAILSANLYGIPNDLAELEKFAADRRITLIDDAAQALGASFAGRPAGGFGAAGMLSFEKGKNITTILGGALVTRSGALADGIEKVVSALPASSAATSAAALLKVPAYALGLHPAAYDFVRRLPGLALGATVYDPAFLIARYPNALTPLALRMADRLDDLNASRRGVAARLQAALNDVQGVGLPVIHPQAEAVFVRQPCFVEPPARATCLAALDAAGVGATTSYPQAICDVPDLQHELHPADKHMPGARRIAATIITLPTHAYCPGDLELRVAAAFNSSLHGATR